MKTLFLSVCFFTNFLVSAQTNDDLVKACMTGNLADVKSLVEKGADVNAKNSAGTFPIESALLSADITKYLIEKGAKVDLEYPILVRAAYFGNPEIIKMLLDAGADPNKPALIDISAGMKKALEDEKAKGKSANKKLIEAYEKEVEKTKEPLKIYAVQKLINGSNSLESLKLLVDHGAKTDVINSITGGNLLHEFASTGRTKKARIAANQFNAPYFEKAGNTVPDWYKNPDTTKMASPDEIVKYLVSKGVDINAKGGQDKTPLIDALMVLPDHIESEVILAFVNNGSDLNVEYLLIGRPFIAVAGYGWVDVLQAMLNKGADINQTCKMEDPALGQRLDGMNALMYACTNNHLDAVKLLLSKQISLKGEATGLIVKNKCLTNVEGKTAIYFGIESGNMDIIQALVDAKFWGGTSLLIKEHAKQTKQDMGSVTLVTTTCYEAGRYIPSQYAKALGFPDMQKFLKKKLE